MTPGYQAPKKVDLKTIQDLDKDDESLVKYKQQLLGQTSEVKGENQQTHTCRGETVLFFFLWFLCIPTVACVLVIHVASHALCVY